LREALISQALFRQSKIAYFDLKIMSQEDILGLQVSVHNILLMADKDSFDELGKDLEVLVAIWALALFDELMQIKPRTVFHLNEKIEAQIRLVQVTVFHD
jgi:hypothetical protein